MLVPLIPKLAGVIPLSTEVSGTFRIALLVVDSDEIPKLVVPVTELADSCPKVEESLTIIL